MHYSLLENCSQGVWENVAAKPAEEDAVTKTGKAQATFSKVWKAVEEAAQKNLDEEIAKMISEGGPT